jgi:hypothetical protein
MALIIANGQNLKKSNDYSGDEDVAFRTVSD